MFHESQRSSSDMVQHQQLQEDHLQYHPAHQEHQHQHQQQHQQRQQEEDEEVQSEQADGPDDDLSVEAQRDPELFSTCPIRKRCLFSYKWSHGYGAPWVPTAPETITAIAHKVRWLPHDSFLDLGCGDGALLLGLRRHLLHDPLHAHQHQHHGFNSTTLRGVDLDESLVQEAKEKAMQQGAGDTVKFELGDVLDETLDMPVSAVLLFMLPALMVKMSTHLVRLLERGALHTNKNKHVGGHLDTQQMHNTHQGEDPNLKQVLDMQRGAGGVTSTVVVSVLWPLPDVCAPYLLRTFTPEAAREVTHHLYTETRHGASHSDDAVNHWRESHQVFHVYSAAAWRLVNHKLADK